MRITNHVFQDAYENSNSSEFKALSKQVTTQVKVTLWELHLCSFDWNLFKCKQLLVSALNGPVIWLRCLCCPPQLKAIYGKSPLLAKCYVGSTVQAFRSGSAPNRSEGVRLSFLKNAALGYLHVLPSSLCRFQWRQRCCLLPVRVQRPYGTRSSRGQSHEFNGPTGGQGAAHTVQTWQCSSFGGCCIFR